MTTVALKRWEKTRQMGRAKFVLMMGGLWGVPFALLFSFMFSFAARHLMQDNLTFSKMLIFPVTLPTSLLGGILFGAWLWRGAERDYRRWKSTGECDD
jgi:hypothetical protein